VGVPPAWDKMNKMARTFSQNGGELFFFFPVPVCAITASGVPGGTLVSMNHFSTLCR
jgi:hypothetical protein